MANEPEIAEIIAESGEVSDELDYYVNMKLMEELGGGFTACQPSMVKLNDGRQVIKMGIDYTYIDAGSGQVMGYGLVGSVFVLEVGDKFDILYITPKNELDEKVQYVMESDIEPQPRPRGKY